MLFSKKEEKTILETVQEKVSAYENALAEVQASLDAAIAKRDEAKAAMDAAADANDEAAFSSAKAKLHDAETSVEMQTMRRARLTEKGALTKVEADAAVNDLVSQIQRLDTEACAEISRQLEAINTLVTQQNAEAKKLYWDLDKICRLLGRDFPDDSLRGRNSGNYIHAAEFISGQIVIRRINEYERLRKIAKRL